MVGVRRFALFLRCRVGSEFDDGLEAIVLSNEDGGLMLAGVYKSRLGTRPPRKRSAPVAGKWIRTDEAPLLAGFRMCGAEERYDESTDRQRIATWHSITASNRIIWP